MFSRCQSMTAILFVAGCTFWLSGTTPYPYSRPSLAAIVASAPLACTWKFERYEPSKFEQLFLLNADAWGKKPCIPLAGMQAQTHEWIKVATQSAFGPLDANLSADVISALYYKNSCSNEQKRVPIEPIGGTNRHPSVCWELDRYLLDKNGWLIVGWDAPPARTFYFDAGASLWKEGLGGASQDWMWETYVTKRQHHIAGIYAWELAKHDPANVWAQIPKEVKHIYHWYNIPVSVQLRHPDNPLELLTAVRFHIYFIMSPDF